MQGALAPADVNAAQTILGVGVVAVVGCLGTTAGTKRGHCPAEDSVGGVFKIACVLAKDGE